MRKNYICVPPMHNGLAMHNERSYGILLQKHCRMTTNMSKNSNNFVSMQLMCSYNGSKTREQLNPASYALRVSEDITAISCWNCPQKHPQNPKNDRKERF